MSADRRYRFDGHRPAIVERPKWVDTDKQWKPKLRELAAQMHYEPRGIWFWFRQISLSIFLETKWPQSCAEATAFHCVSAVFDKRGQEPS